MYNFNKIQAAHEETNKEFENMANEQHAICDTIEARHATVNDQMDAAASIINDTPVVDTDTVIVSKHQEALDGIDQDLASLLDF